MSEVRCPTCAKPREPRADLPVAWCADCDVSFPTRPDRPFAAATIAQPVSPATRVLGFALCGFFGLATVFQVYFAVSDGILNADLRARAMAGAIALFLALISAASGFIALQRWTHETAADGARVTAWPLPIGRRFIPAADVRRIVAQPPPGQRGRDYEIVVVPGSGPPLRLTGAYPSRDAAERALMGFIG